MSPPRGRPRRQPRTALAEIGGLAVGSVALAIGGAFLIVAATPEPQAPRMTAALAASALRGEAAGSPLVRTTGGEPRGVRAPLVEAVLARRLGAAPQAVRAIWSAPVAGSGPGPTTVILRTPAGREVRRTVTIPPNAWGPRPPDPLLSVLADVPQPAFTAALRRNDGRWTVVRPATPFWSGWRLRLLAAFLAGSALLAPAAWLMARRITRPLRRLAARAAEADLWVASTPLQEGSREVQAAAAAMDAMRTRLAGQAAARSRMLAAVAHDLRTPLTGLRLRAESAPPAARARMADDIARMEAMITRVLEYAEGDARPSEAVDLTAVVRELVGEAVSRGGAVTFEDASPLLIRADAADVRRAVGNLLDNAVAYAGGARLRATGDATTATVRVEDDGPGIPPGDRPRLLEPFERGETSRNHATGGVGLGLSIVRDVAARHHGALELGDSAAGGLRVTLSFPLFTPP